MDIMKKFAQLIWWKKVVAIATILLLLAILSVVFVFSYRGSTKGIESVADGFRAPASWRLESQEMTPPKFVCLEGACPYLYKVWVSDREVTREDYRNFIKSNSKIDLQYEECKSYPVDQAERRVCEAQARSGEFAVTFSLVSDPGEATKVSLSIREDK